MLLIAKNEIGIIKPGMRFSFIRESGDFVETYCIELDMNFKLAKSLLNSLEDGLGHYFN